GEAGPQRHRDVRLLDVRKAERGLAIDRLRPHRHGAEIVPYQGPHGRVSVVGNFPAHVLMRGCMRTGLISLLGLAFLGFRGYIGRRSRHHEIAAVWRGPRTVFGFDSSGY